MKVMDLVINKRKQVHSGEVMKGAFQKILVIRV
jgi:hypothetical protein